MKTKKINDKDIVLFEKYLISNERSKATVEKYIRDVTYFKNYVSNCNFDKNKIIEYKNFLTTKYTLSSANSMIAALNSFLKFKGLTEFCVKLYVMQNKIYCSENIELSKDEYISLIRTAEKNKKQRLSLIIQTICTTGIRISELKFITIESLYKGEAIVSCKGKTRTVFLVKELRKRLLMYANDKKIFSGHVFVTQNGNAVDRSNIWTEMKKLCIAANVSSSKVFPHNFRHLFARSFYEIDKDIAKLSDVLGHSNINTTRIYIVSTGKEHMMKMENMELLV